MKTIKAQTPCIPVEIEIGDRIVYAEIDTTPMKMLDVADVCKKAYSEAQHWEKDLEAAKRARDTKKAKELIARISKVVGKAVAEVYGDECYAEVLDACGRGGKPAKPADAYNVLVQMLTVANESIAEAQGSMREMTAAQYLAEVEREKDEPDPEA